MECPPVSEMELYSAAMYVRFGGDSAKRFASHVAPWSASRFRLRSKRSRLRCPLSACVKCRAPACECTARQEEAVESHHKRASSNTPLAA
eukprot:3424555-Rhodomonas_salina.5